MEKESNKKFYVEIKQSRRGHYYLGSLKVYADSLEEMERLMDSALSSVMHKIEILNESRFKDEKLKKNKSLEMSDPSDKQLFEELRQWRLELSRKEKIRPFMIFHDTTLKEISLRRPVTSDELYQISGIGSRKYEKYGSILLKIVSEFISKSGETNSDNKGGTNDVNNNTISKVREENNNSKILLQGDKVIVKNKTKYDGEVGKIVGYDGFKYFEIELMSIKQTIICLKSEIEKASSEDFEKYEVEVWLDKKKAFKLKIQNLKPSIDALKANKVLKGIYALGKYYSLQHDSEKHKEDYFSQKILELKANNKHAGKEIAEIYLKFINSTPILKKIIDSIDYIAMMPTTKETNHVSLWGDRICEVLNKEDITKNIYINPEKEVSLRNYVYKDKWARQLTAKDAFKIDKADPSFPSLKNKSCLILDDVCTTGNQIKELTNLLAEEGIKEVYAMVIGKTKFN